MSEGHRFLSDDQLDQLGRNQGQAAWAPGYPKIPNVDHDRKEIDQEALQAFMPVDLQHVDPSMTSRVLFVDLKSQPNTDTAWAVSFTVPALFARVRNLEAQVLAGQRQAEHWEQEARALEARLNVPFITDRRAGAYRLQIRETSKSEDRKCFGLPTVLHVQSYVPRTDFHLQNGDAVYEGRYALLEDHRGQKAGTYAAESEAAIESLTGWLPDQFTAREDPMVIASAARRELKAHRDLKKEHQQLLEGVRAVLPQMETEILAVKKALANLKAGKAKVTNQFQADTRMNTLMALVSALIDATAEEDGVPDEADHSSDMDI